jgi:hypothetical protein
MELSETHYLSIDCAPGSIRPNKILEIILQQLTNNKLTSNDFVKVSTFFGEWKFMLVQSKEEEYEKQMKRISEILQSLYESNYIRYAELGP